jgi:2',3'-cyclic-nucleotide 2'-phosphodiesterase (5'-nucleotidase family)
MVPLLLVLAGFQSVQDPLQVTIVATTDIHGRVMHWDYVNDREAAWGLTRASTAVDSIRRATDNRVVLVDAGDFLEGNPFAAYFATVRRSVLHPVVDALNTMRYDAVTIGNHEFDFGIPFLDSALKDAQFQIVAANVVHVERQTLAYREYAIVERGGVRVGIVGLTTPGAMVWNRDQVAGRREIGPILPAAERALARLAAERVDLKVVLIHSGMRGASSYEASDVGEENVAAQLATLENKPDLVVVGHSHRTIADSVINGVHFIQPESWARGLAVARVRFNREGGRTVVGIDARLISLASTRPDTNLARRMSDAHLAARSWTNVPLGRIQGDPWNAQFARAGDTPLIDFINEVQRRAGGADLSATPAFTVEGGFPETEVRVRHVFGVYPYENTLKVVQIDGATLRAYLEQAADYFATYGTGAPIVNSSVPGYNFDIVSGVDYIIDLSQPPGSRIRQLVRNGRLVQAGDTFTLALNSHRATGTGFHMLAGLPVVRSGPRIIDLLMDEVRHAGTLRSESYFQESWRIIPEAAASAVRAAFGGGARVERTAVRILATADLRGALEPRTLPWSQGRPVGGVVALEHLMDSLDRACGCTTLRLDAGDHLSGSLFADRAFGRSMVDAFNAMGYDAVTVGAEDLAWGIDTLRARVASSNHPWLAANMQLATRPGRPEWAHEWIMVERGGTRTAIVGVTDAPAPVMRDSLTRFVVSDMVTAVNRSRAQAKAAGADVVIVLAHAEAFCDDAGCRGPLFDLVRALPPGSVDLVIGGHADTEATATINDIVVLLPGSEGLSLGVADLVVQANGGKRVNAFVETVWADSASHEDQIEAIVRASRFAADAPIASSTRPLTQPVAEETGLGRLVADAYRTVARAQFAMVLNEDIKAGFAVGPITSRQVYAVQPVQYALVRMTLPGSVIIDMLEQVVRGDVPSAHISGAQVEYDPSRRPGDRVRRVRMSDGHDLRRSEMYVVAVGDRLARGDRGFTMLSRYAAESVGMSDFEALSNYLTRLGGVIEAPPTPRFREN